MTDPRGLRRRRRAGSDGIPQELAEWFAGEAPIEPEGPPPVLTLEQRAHVLRFPHAASRQDRRAVGLPVDPPRASTPWCALIYPDSALLQDRWRAWKRGKGRVKPPVGYEWLDAPGDSYIGRAPRR